MVVNKPTCPICSKETKYYKEGTMKSYWGDFLINYKDVPIYMCVGSCEKIYSLRVVTIAQEVTKILSELKSTINEVSLKNILIFIEDDQAKQEVFFSKLTKQEVFFIKSSDDTFYIDELQLIKLDRFFSNISFEEGLDIAARDGNISQNDIDKIDNCTKEAEDSSDDKK
ncbi:hypothetical protein G15_3410 [Enterococcus avium]|nr:hypothetical protein G15_3410 [Enterococcus avium]